MTYGALALRSLVVGTGLVAAFAIGRSSVDAPKPEKPTARRASPFGSSRELTQDLPAAFAPTPAATPFFADQARSGLPLAGDISVTTAVAARSAHDAGTSPFDARALTPPPPVPPSPAPAAAPVATPAAPPDAGVLPLPPPPPNLVSQGRVFDGTSITGSSFDQQDVENYDLVRSSWDDVDREPNRPITSSRFDDEDVVDYHPTGR